MSQLLGQKSEQPAVCGCCLRGSGNVGAIDAPGVGSVLWLCEGCKVPIGHKVLQMNTMKLDATESAAILTAASATAEHFLSAVLQIAFDNSIKSIEHMTPEQFQFLITTIKTDKTFQGAAAMMLVTYSNEIRRLVTVA